MFKNSENSWLSNVFLFSGKCQLYDSLFYYLLLPLPGFEVLLAMSRYLAFVDFFFHLLLYPSRMMYSHLMMYPVYQYLHCCTVSSILLPYFCKNFVVGHFLLVLLSVFLFCYLYHYIVSNI